MRPLWLLVLLVPLAGCINLDGPNLSGHDATLPPSRLHLLLTNADADRILVAPYYVPGRAPVDSALEVLRDRLLEATGKREVVLLPAKVLAVASTSTEHNWTSEERQALFATLVVPQEERSVAMPLLYLDGYGYSFGARAIALNGPDFISVFPDQFRGAGVNAPVHLKVPLELSDRIERQVVVHEAGHTLGLVDNGVPMVRRHVDSSDVCLCHSSNPDSVMSAGAETLDTTLTRLATGTAHDRFDADDLADLRAFQAAQG